MKCWLIYNKKDALRNSHYINMYFDECKKLDIDIRLIYDDEISLDSEKPDFCIFRAINPEITKRLEDNGILVFNNSKVSEICNDKRKTYKYISDNGIEIMELFDEDNKEFPCVVKSAYGRGGTEVFLVKNEAAYNKITLKDRVIQRACNNPGRDLRVYVIGKEIIASILRKSDTDFRSNYSLGGSASVYNLSDYEKSVVNKIISLFDFGLVGIDFIFHNGKIVFNEIEDVVGARMLYEKTDINLIERYLKYIIEERLWEKF